MKWSNEKPNKPGWYWYRSREGKDPSIVRLYGENRMHFDFGGYDAEWEYDSLNGQFAGPIPEPEEPGAPSPNIHGLIFGDDVKIVAPEGFEVFPKPLSAQTIKSSKPEEPK